MTDQEFFQKCDNLQRRIKQLEAATQEIAQKVCDVLNKELQ